ncbi:MAG: hypothetical protein RI885_413 [Actinomycetota bacterium]|jgi:hypothetical protein
MLRHIVLWRLAAEGVAERARDSSTIATALEALVSVIPEIVSLTVSTNAADIPRNWDVCLIGDFADETALGVYLRHPDHVRAADVVGELVTERAAIDLLV